MGIAKIDIDNLAVTIMSELENYMNVTLDTVEQSVIKTSKMTVKALREKSPKLTGDYAKNWSYKRDSNLRGRYRFDMVVYEKKPEYRLTHILEKGYQSRYGGRVAPKAHIATAEKNAYEMLKEMILQGL